MRFVQKTLKLGQLEIPESEIEKGKEWNKIVSTFHMQCFATSYTNTRDPRGWRSQYSLAHRVSV